LNIICRVALYQASVSGLCDGPSGNLSVRLSVGMSVCLSAKCIVAKRLSVSGCRWDGEWCRSRYGCIRLEPWSSTEKGQFWGWIGGVPL